MYLATIKTDFETILTSIYGKNETESLFYIVVYHFYKLNRIDVSLQPTFKITETEVLQWRKIIKALQEQQPIQYILRETFFFGLKFKVTPATLIPRQETEELVNWILQTINKEQKNKIIDIGTGSGCIAISIKKNAPKVTMYALDVAAQALDVAKENAQNNEVTITFLHTDILTIHSLNKKYNVIVSNPPYVRDLEKKEIQKNVINYEPHSALFVPDNNPLLFYKKIAELAQENLVNKGWLFFEINQYLAKETKELLASLGFINIEIKKDLFGNYRMIKCQKK